MEPRIAHLPGVELAFDTFGPAEGPTVLLLAGNGCSAVFWPEAFCSALSRACGLGVVRYDHRDTGRSTHGQEYAAEDLAADALALLDHLGRPRAHLVGLSLGGFLAQAIAVEHPARVASLTVMMSTPDYGSLLEPFMEGRPSSSDLQALTPEFMAALARIPESLSFVDRLVENWRAANGTRARFDEAYWRALQEEALQRGNDEASGAQHRTASLRSAWRDLRPRLRALDVPALVLHGTEDPIFPPAHARATAAAIPGAQLRLVDGLGHALNPDFFEEIVGALAAHVRHAGESGERA